MIRIKYAVCFLSLLCILFAGPVSAEISTNKAIDIGKDKIKTLTDQTYHYRVEYDTVVAIPVHSKIKWKNDFYLLYFLNNDFFEAEVEIDAETGEAALMALKKMSQPYYELHTGTFNHRYFSPDSIAIYSQKRHSIQIDSVRMVFFGVIPKLGKRGVIWEIFSPDGQRYQSLSGASLTYDQITSELNTNMRRAGNYTADEIRYDEINAELKRLDALSDQEKKDLKLTPDKLEEYIQSLNNEKKDLLTRFTELRGKDKEREIKNK